MEHIARIPVAILGATGIVGQKVIALLNPSNSSFGRYFSVAEVTASEIRNGLAFKDVCTWKESLMPDDYIGDLICRAPQEVESSWVISCLPTHCAASIETALAEQGKLIFSNASVFRMHPQIPLVIPEVNRSHLDLIQMQTTPGKIIKNPNCSAVGVALALAPLQKLSQIQHVSVITMQSVSGAGYTGDFAVDLLGNTVPHIPSEAEKIKEETKKILGTAYEPASFPLSVNVHRVPVVFGHSATLHITFTQPISPEQIRGQYELWNTHYLTPLFVIHSQPGRPQSIKDLRPDDMRVHIGHIEQGDTPSVITFVILTHNLVRGAAGAALINMWTYLQNIKHHAEHLNMVAS